jgi:long-chain fatty acid transport protein
MKRTIKLALAATMALSATSAFATNGDHLIGTGAKARGMGGIGIGMSHGAESALANPALITSVKDTEISFGGTIFMPDVNNQVYAVGGDTSYQSSAADMSVIPEVSIATSLGDGWYIGVGMFGTAGMGVDYRDVANTTMNNHNMITNLQLMQFAVPVAYKEGSFSFGIAPVLQYGSLDINYDTNGSAPGNGSTTQGVAQDFGFGVNLGIAYEMDNLTIGASYKTAIDMQYKGQISQASTNFQINPLLTDNLEQPAEIGVGLSYVMGEHTLALDYKKIKWGSAKGYKDFNWEDQNVYILGYEYNENNWALRAGYNYAKSPIKELATTAANFSQINLFNLLGFPGMVEKHYTIGGSYEFSKLVSCDIAYVYSPEATETFSIWNQGLNAGAGGLDTVSTKHSQDAISMQVNFNF